MIESGYGNVKAPASCNYAKRMPVRPLQRTVPFVTLKEMVIPPSGAPPFDHIFTKETPTMSIARRNSAYTLLLLANSFCVPLVIAGTYTVTTTRDSVLGSFRQAIQDANTHTGPDTILFNIPTSDPGFTAGVFTIRPASSLPGLTDDGTVVDGTSQATNQGDTNPVGPEVELDGTNAGTTSCIVITGGKSQIKGLVINRFLWIAIEIQNAKARNAIIVGNYIGTDATGMVRRGNGYGGVWVRFGANGARIGGTTAAERNIISGTTTSVNLATGTGIYVEKTDSVQILGNYIGVNRDATATIPNASIGVCIRESRAVVVGGTGPGEGNVIGGSGGEGIVFRMPTATQCIVSGNFIGTNASGTVNLGNGNNGVYMDYGARRNTIGPGNSIKFSGGHGIYISHDSTVANTITRNLITNNGGQGIANTNGGNTGIAPPTIGTITAGSVSGSALRGSTVELFSDSSDEGAKFLGATIADAGGSFIWNGTPLGPKLTATCTDSVGNTSQFSVAAVVTGIRLLTPGDIPDGFALAQNYPNPFNPMTTIHYQLSTISDVRLTVHDLLGREVAVLVNERREAGVHEVTFDGSFLASGVYLYRLQAGGFVETRKLVLVQ